MITVRTQKLETSRLAGIDYDSNLGLIRLHNAAVITSFGLVLMTIVINVVQMERFGNSASDASAAKDIDGGLNAFTSFARSTIRTFVAITRTERSGIATMLTDAFVRLSIIHSRIITNMRCAEAF